MIKRTLSILTFLQNACFDLSLFLSRTCLKIRNRTGYSSFLNTPDPKKSIHSKTCILKELGYIGFISCFFYLNQGFAWNAAGHRIVAEIAYQHLTPHARLVFDGYNRALDKAYQPESFVNSASWLDRIRFKDIPWFDTIHYSNISFTDENVTLPPMAEINAVYALEQSIKVLQSTKSNVFDKGISLRIFIHVIGDIHQPMHAVSRVSKKYPQGDQGGNLKLLGKNVVADNLHSYWDKGAGILISQRHYTDTQITEMASDIENRWPCEAHLLSSTPYEWASESHDLAVNVAYTIKEGAIPGKSYQKKAQKIIEQRIALAGCRLSYWLNKIDKASI